MMTKATYSAIAGVGKSKTTVVWARQQGMKIIFPSMRYYIAGLRPWVDGYIQKLVCWYLNILERRNNEKN